MTCDVYRPAIFYSRGNMRKRVSILAAKAEMMKKTLEKRIFEEGLKAIEENIEKGNVNILLNDELRRFFTKICTKCIKTTAFLSSSDST